MRADVGELLGARGGDAPLCAIATALLRVDHAPRP
jgi:hypothetical protein